jgi:hypothetical protein
MSQTGYTYNLLQYTKSTSSRQTITRLLLLARSGNVEHKVHNISILHDIVASFLPVLAGRLDVRHGLLIVAQALKVVVRADLGLDEATLKVGVDGTGSFRGSGSAGDGPASNLIFT